LIDSSERRTVTIIWPVVKQAKCHLGDVELNIENKGLVLILGGIDGPRQALNPIL